MERDTAVLESLNFQVAPDQSPQRRGWHRVVTYAQDTEAGRQRARGEHVPPADAAPDPPELVRRVDRLRARCEEGGIDRARRGADQQIGANVSLVERMQHPGMRCAETRTARQDKRDSHGSYATRRPPPSSRSRCSASRSSWRLRSSPTPSDAPISACDVPPWPSMP